MNSDRKMNVMEKKIVISIGRQFGGGGRAVGKALAQRLNIDYYDKGLISLAAKEFGFAPQFFEEADEQSTHFFGNIMQWVESLSTSGIQSKNFLSSDALFKMQSDAIRKLSEERACVIVGRCSDYVLRDNPNCVSVFLHSSDKDRVARICSRASISEEMALEKMKIEDKKRAAYYNFYSNKVWGASATYSLSIDVSSLGEEETVDLILIYLRKRFPDLVF